jgi:hypothetical protein
MGLKDGGEGGIRTLDTGVSQYNGLANESFAPPSLVFNHLRSHRSFSIGLRGLHSALIVLRFVRYSTGIISPSSTARGPPSKYPAPK